MNFKEFLAESKSYTNIQKLVIASWGRLLYLNYLDLPHGKDYSNSNDLENLATEYNAADEDEQEELDDWISDGAPLKNGSQILNRTTIDRVFTSCQSPAPNEMILYRFSDNVQLKPNSWISVTSDEKGPYSGKKTVINVPKGTKIIDTVGLCDKGEYIISTNVLIELLK